MGRSPTPTERKVQELINLENSYRVYLREEEKIPVYPRELEAIPPYKHNIAALEFTRQPAPIESVPKVPEQEQAGVINQYRTRKWYREAIKDRFSTPGTALTAKIIGRGSALGGLCCVDLSVTAYHVDLFNTVSSLGVVISLLAQRIHKRAKNKYHNPTP